MQQNVHEQVSSEKLRQIQQLIEVAAANSPNMAEAQDPKLPALLAERNALDEKIRALQREGAEIKFNLLSKGQAFHSVLGEVLALIVMSDVAKLKKGFIQRAAPEKAELYSVVLAKRISGDMLRCIPHRRELHEVFGDAWIRLAFPL